MTYLPPGKTNVVASAGASQTIPDASVYTADQLTLSATSCALTFPTAAVGKSFALVLKQDTTGGRAVTWPRNVLFAGAVAPTLATSPGKVDQFQATCLDGTNWIVSQLASNAATVPVQATYDTTVSARQQNGGTVTRSMTISTGTNRFLIVFTASNGSSAVMTSVTYGGVALTRLASVLNVGQVGALDVWYLVNPAGGANNLVIDDGGAGQTYTYSATSFTNVSQSAPLGAAQTSAPASGGTSVSVSVTDSAASTNYVIASMICSDSSVTLTPGGSQTLIDGNPGHGFPGPQQETTTQPGASGTVTPSFTISASQGRSMLAVAVLGG